MNSSDRILARRYALAIVPRAQGPQEAQAADARLADLRSMRAAIAGDMAFFLNPLLPEAPKSEVLGLRLQGRENTDAFRFLALLLRVKRFNLLDAIVEEAGRVSDENNGVARGRAVSAAPLDAQERQSVARAVGAMTGRKAELEFTEDAALLGGVRLEVGDILIDGSLRGRIGALGRRLNG